MSSGGRTELRGIEIALQVACEFFRFLELPAAVLAGLVLAVLCGWLILGVRGCIEGARYLGTN